MVEWKQYRRTGITEMRPWGPDVDMTNVSVSSVDQQAGSPKPGDYIARNINDRADQWLVSAAFFERSGFEVVVTEPADPIADLADEMKARNALP
jgi:hypothetical protein